MLVDSLYGLCGPDGLESNYVLNSVLWQVLSRFAVPCFVMISGAFILANDKNADFSYFYKKSVHKFLLPLLLFSLLYYVYSNILLVGGHFLIQKPETLSLEVLFEPLLSWIKGEPFYHLWYMYMLIGLYLFVPILVHLKKQIGEKFFEKVAWSLLIFSGLFAWGEEVTVHWNPSYCFDYIGYFMIGYVLRRKAKKNNLKGISLICVGLIIEVLIAFLGFEEITHGTYRLLVPLCPFIILASVFIFYGFALLSIRRSFAYLSGLTFVIYLVHAGILQVIQILSGKHFLDLYDLADNTIVIIPFMCTLVFVLSAIFAHFYERLSINMKMESMFFGSRKNY